MRLFKNELLSGRRRVGKEGSVAKHCADEDRR
jgi:hypothetical protein